MLGANSNYAAEVDAKGAHIVGYFSKEKRSADNYNLACILTLPPYQRKGYGSFMISLSYEMSRRLGVPGSPEKPLTDLGALSYRYYWKYAVLRYILDADKPLSVRSIAMETGICTEDVTKTLESLDMVTFARGAITLYISRQQIEKHLSTYKSPPRVIHPTLLRWPVVEAAR